MRWTERRLKRFCGTSPDDIELVTMFKSPTRRLLQADGGVEDVASTGSEQVLSFNEIDALAAAAKKIEDSLEPTKNSAGQNRPWDIEYGFADNKAVAFPGPAIYWIGGYSKSSGIGTLGRSSSEFA